MKIFAVVIENMLTNGCCREACQLIENMEFDSVDAVREELKTQSIVTGVSIYTMSEFMESWNDADDHSGDEDDTLDMDIVSKSFFTYVKIK